MTTKTTKSYYAIEWAYGRAADDKGNRIASYHAFDSAAARKEWIDNGNPYVTNPGSREAINADDAELRRILRDMMDRRGYREVEYH